MLCPDDPVLAENEPMVGLDGPPLSPNEHSPEQDQTTIVTDRTNTASSTLHSSQESPQRNLQALVEAAELDREPTSHIAFLEE